MAREDKKGTLATHFYGAYVKTALATQLIVLYNATGQYLTA